ncbi:MAG: hypothetical protein RR370_01770 [Synergistaceae bacterium]
MKKNKISSTLIHGIDCVKSVTVTGILGYDDKQLYIENEEGIEIPLPELLSQFEDSTVTLTITSKEEVII